MKKSLKRIEKAALKKYPRGYFGNDIGKRAFIIGAKSPEAKLHWQQGMYDEEEVKVFVLDCLKATGKEIISTMKNIGNNAYIEFNGDDFERWFNKNKK